MDAHNEKDYVDARMQAVIERLNGEAGVHRLSTDARLDKLDQTIEFGLKSAREEVNTRLAQLDASYHRGQSEVIKWIVGAILASTAVSVSTITLLLTQVTPRPAISPMPAPIIIYPQPVPAASVTPSK
ncbi:hypothetical protein SAMN05192549_10761 [Duganella sacchari]|uniref:Uncharacterized protein n=1 Tax=Duganella sacchari TaxID=551987 RepID=A0A1M7QHJ2_9BURK|nr:hypothetical protein [Duganella sacchari]SHN30357.1 hypothetical protein SAMN05192549_10761 [Duganella sacchari]